MVNTYNSKHDVNGNRLNLVVNTDTKELWFYGCNCFNKGSIYEGCGIREVNRIKKEYISEGYKQVAHDVARNW